MRTILTALIALALTLALGACAGVQPDNRSNLNSSDLAMLDLDGVASASGKNGLTWTDEAVTSLSNNDPFTISMDQDGFDGSGVGSPRAVSVQWGDLLLNLLAGDDAGLEDFEYTVTDADGTSRSIKIGKANLSSSTATIAQQKAAEFLRDNISRVSEDQARAIIESVRIQTEGGVAFGEALFDAISEIAPGILSGL